LRKVNPEQSANSARVWWRDSAKTRFLCLFCPQVRPKAGLGREAGRGRVGAERVADVALAEGVSGPLQAAPSLSLCPGRGFSRVGSAGPGFLRCAGGGDGAREVPALSPLAPGAEAPSIALALFRSGRVSLRPATALPHQPRPSRRLRGASLRGGDPPGRGPRSSRGFLSSCSPAPAH
jgi:hypothetical protein